MAARREPLDFTPAEPVPITPPRVARALVDHIGGYEAGWGLWLSACGKIEQALLDARDSRDPFCSFPTGRLERLTFQLHEAIMLAATAAEIQLAVGEDPPSRKPAECVETIAELLHDRAAELARRRAVV
jgi:hypothetical protein